MQKTKKQKGRGKNRNQKQLTKEKKPLVLFYQIWNKYYLIMELEEILDNIS